MTKSPCLPTSIDPIVLCLLIAAAALRVTPHKASEGVTLRLRQAKLIAKGRDKQWAFGQKSVAIAVGTPLSIIYLAGGGCNFRINWVVGKIIPTVYFSAIALIPSGDN